MGIFDRVLIFSDIDSTFLGKGGVLVPRNLEAIEAFKKEGGLFTFATGRLAENLYAVIPSAAELSNFPAVLANGTCLCDLKARTVYRENFMDGETLRALLAFVTEFDPEMGIRASVPSGFLVEKLTPRVERDIAAIRDLVKICPISEWDLSRVYKVVFRAEPEAVDRLRIAVEAKFGSLLTYAKSNPTFYEVQNGGVSKGSMIAAIREEMKSAGKTRMIYAVGDNENDIEMLKEADIAVCPSNAIPAVREIADLVLCDNNSGVIADLIDRIAKKETEAAEFLGN